MRKAKYPFLAVAGMAALLGCATNERGIETPIGLRSGHIFGGQKILGLSHMVTKTGNLEDAFQNFAERITIEVPVGTQIIVPAVQSWSLMYGKAKPEDLGLDENAQTPDFTATLFERKYAAGLVRVNVLDIDAPDMSAVPPRQTATIGVQMWLTDAQLNKKWFGFVEYSLLYLASTNTLTLWQPVIPRPTPIR